MQPINCEAPVLVPGVLDPDTCARLVTEATARGFSATGADYPASYRDNDRLVRDDPSLSAELFARVRGILPARRVDGAGTRWRLSGLNTRFRMCRYTNGQGFRIHRDGAHAPSPDARSFLTLQLYLDDVEDSAGGHTRFYAGRRGPLERAVRPRKGAAIVFAHDLWHDGEPVVRGTKHVLRTDVMYARETPAPPVEDYAVLRGHDGYVWKVLPLSDGGLATASRDRTLRLWSHGPGGLTCTRVLEGHGGSVLTLVEPSPERLWSGSRDREVREWDLVTGRSRLVARHDGAVLCLERLGGRIGCGLTDGTIQLFDLDGTPRARLSGHAGWVRALAPLSGTRFVSGSEDGAVRVWDARGECLHAALPGRGPVHALASLDGDRVAAGFADGHVIVYAAQGGLAATQVIAAHHGEVYGLAGGPGGLLASGGEDDRARPPGVRRRVRRRATPPGLRDVGRVPRGRLAGQRLLRRDGPGRLTARLCAPRHHGITRSLDDPGALGSACQIFRPARKRRFEGGAARRTSPIQGAFACTGIELRPQRAAPFSSDPPPHSIRSALCPIRISAWEK